MHNKTRWSTLIVLTALVSQTGCYTTKVMANRPEERMEMTDRQWFTIGGLVPLSSPAGRECTHGLARVESQLSFVDWLINVGLAVGGGVAGSLACNSNQDPAARASCAGVGASLMPFLLGSRTVTYTCVAPPASAAVELIPASSTPAVATAPASSEPAPAPPSQPVAENASRP